MHAKIYVDWVERERQGTYVYINIHMYFYIIFYLLGFHDSFR